MEFIVAGNFSQAINFARRKNWGRSQFKFVPVNNYSGLMGMRNRRIWFTGTWRDRSDAGYLKDLVIINNMEVYRE